jgi:asparagine synthase (glutamine-hydrolysing)
MLHSLEVRAPFLDRDLTDFAARLPASFVRRGKTTKRILKHAFPEFLPDALVNRPKMGFGVPLGAWFRGSLRTLLHDQLGSGARLYRYVSRPHVEKLLAEQDAKVADHSHRLWLLLTLEVWLASMEKAS